MTCIICGGQHRGWERCKVANTDVVANVVANKAPEPVANRHGKHADKAKRREYMKRYMAKRRALPPH